MIDHPYEFDRSFQLRLLALLVQEPEAASGVIEPRYFTHPAHVDIARVIRDAYAGKDPKSFRLTRSSLWALVWRDVKRGGARKRELKESYKEVVGDIFKLPLPDKEVLLELASDFTTQARYRGALVEAERDITDGRYHKVVGRFRDLEPLGADPTRVVQLPVFHLHRFITEEEDLDEADNHLVYPIIPKRGAVLLYGLPKELKSWMAAAIAMDAACGRKALGFFPVARPVKTLYVQVEDPEFLTQQRIRELARSQGRGLPVGMLKIIPRCPLNLMDPAWLAALTAEIKAFRPELLVLDVFRRLFRGNVADSKETAEFLRTLDTLRDTYGCADLLVHHAKKGETTEIQTKALGSVNLTAWADVLLYTAGKRRDDSTSVADLYIETKTAMLDEEKLVVTVNSEAVPIVRVWSADQHEMDRLLRLMFEAPGLNQKQLEEKSGMAEKRLRGLLKRGVKKGLWFEKHGARKTLLYCPAEGKGAKQ